MKLIRAATIIFTLMFLAGIFAITYYCVYLLPTEIADIFQRHGTDELLRSEAIRSLAFKLTLFTGGQMVLALLVIVLQVANQRNTTQESVVYVERTPAERKQQVQSRKKGKNVDEEDETTKHYRLKTEELKQILTYKDFTPEQKAEKLLSTLCATVNAISGAVLSKSTDEGRDILELKAGYALSNIEAGSGLSMEMNEGIPGQALAENKEIIVNHIPEEYIIATSGLGSSSTGTLLVIPFWQKRDPEVPGVLELAVFHQLEAQQVAYIREAAAIIAQALGASTDNTDAESNISD